MLIMRLPTIALFLVCTLSLISSPAVFGQTGHERDVSQAEMLIDQQQIDEALNLYRQILTRYEQRPPSEISEAELGKLHLRLAQVYLKRAQVESSGDVMLLLESYAALHFWRCSRTKGLDSLLRDDICRRQVMERMAPLQVRGKFKELFVSHPEAFRGVIRPNMLLPKGQVILRVTPERGPPTQKLINIPQETPLIFQAEPSLTAQPPLLNKRNTAGLILRPQGASDEQSNPSSKTLHSIPSAPGYVMVAIGVVGLVIGGLAQAGIPAKPPAGKERTVKWSFISGASLMAVGGGWIALTW